MLPPLNAQDYCVFWGIEAQPEDLPHLPDEERVGGQLIAITDSDFCAQDSLVRTEARLQGGPNCGREDSLVLGTGAGTGIARSWRVREGKKWTRSWATVVGSRPWRCGSRERSRRGSWISVQWRAYEPRRGTADLDEMAEDPVDPRGVGDDSENPHAVSTARTDERALTVDLCDKPGPCGGGAAIFERLQRAGGDPCSQVAPWKAAKGAGGGGTASRRCGGPPKG